MNPTILSISKFIEKIHVFQIQTKIFNHFIKTGEKKVTFSLVSDRPCRVPVMMGQKSGIMQLEAIFNQTFD